MVQKLDMLALLCQNMYLVSITLSIVLICSLYLLAYSTDQIVLGQNVTTPLPLIRDSDLEVELVAKHLNFPTAIDFLGDNDLLISEKNTGNVYEVINGNITGPLLHIDVGVKDERGLLGLATSANANNNSQEGSSV